MISTEAVVLLCLTALPITNGWVLNVNKIAVTSHLTQNVTMTCNNENNANNNTGMVTVYQIRLSQFTKDNVWKTVASLTSRQTVVKTSLTDATVIGRVDTIHNSFLKATFKIATDQSMGQFLCEVDGFDGNEDIKVTKTPPVLVKSKMASYDDILKTVLEIKKKEENDVDGMKYKVTALQKNIDDINHTIANISVTQQQLTGLIERLTNGQIFTSIEKILGEKMAVLQSNISDRIEASMITVNNKIANLTDNQKTASLERNEIAIAIANLTNDQHAVFLEKERTSEAISNITEQQATIKTQINQISSMINTIMTDSPYYAWPSGKYLLPQSDTGCPNTSVTTWQSSHIKISTGPVATSNDSTSSDINMAGKVLQVNDGNSYVLLMACRMESDGGHMEWPAGNYCIQGNKFNYDGYDDRYCPTKFHYGEIVYGRYYDGKLDDVVNMDVGKYSFQSYIPYCCRQDGSVHEAILLPNHSPFYLYRFGGHCQEVFGMDVEEQWIHLGTGRWGGFINNWYASKDNNIYHPDGWVDHKRTDDTNKGVHIDMCYYTPRD